MSRMPRKINFVAATATALITLQTQFSMTRTCMMAGVCTSPGIPRVLLLLTNTFKIVKSTRRRVVQAIRMHRSVGETHCVLQILINKTCN